MTDARVKAGTSQAAASNRRALFIEAMIANGGNQTQAAIAAGYPEKSAHVRGAELVKDRKVAAELERRRAEAAEKAKLTADEVLVSLARALRFDPRKLFQPNGTLKPIAELDDDTALVLQSLEIDEILKERAVIGHTKKVKATDRNVAREQAMRHFGLYDRDNRQRTDAIRELLARIDGKEESRGIGLIRREA